MHENVFSYVTLNVNTIVHNKKLTIVIVYRQVIEKNNSKYKSCQFQRCKQVIKFDSAYKISIVIAHCTYKHCQSKIAIMHTKVLKCNCSFIQNISIAIFNKNIHNQNDAQKSGQLRYIKKLSIALVQTKVINCNFANKVVSCNLCTQKLSQLRRNLAIFLQI